MYFSLTQVFEKKPFVCFHKNPMYLAYATLIHCQGNWYYGKLPHCLTPLKLNYLPSLNSESRNAISRERPGLSAVMQKPCDVFRS